MLEVERFPAYVKVYAKHHGIPCRLIHNNAFLTAAAMLEFKANVTRRITITEARRQFVAQYKWTNKIETSAKTISLGNGRYIAGSALTLLKPIKGTRWEYGFIEGKKETKTTTEFLI